MKMIISFNPTISSNFVQVELLTKLDTGGRLVAECSVRPQRKNFHMQYSFLAEDYAALDRQIENQKDRMRETGKEMGDSCKEGAETFHDNFAFEDGERTQRMISQRLRELTQIRNHARVVQPAPPGRVGIGRTVILEDESGEQHTYRVGSYMTFTPDDTVVSYASPLARLLIGAKPGDIRKGVVAGQHKKYTVLEVK